MASHIAVTAFY